MPFITSHPSPPKPSIMKAAPNTASGSGQSFQASWWQEKVTVYSRVQFNKFTLRSFPTLSDLPPPPQLFHQPSMHPSLHVSSAAPSPLLRKPILAHSNLAAGSFLWPNLCTVIIKLRFHCRLGQRIVTVHSFAAAICLGFGS